MSIFKIHNIIGNADFDKYRELRKYILMFSRIQKIPSQKLFSIQITDTHPVKSNNVVTPNF